MRLARSRIDIARGNLDDAAADLEAVELLARATTGPRQRLPLLVLFTALALWRRRPEVALAHVEDGFTVVEAGADDILAVAPLVWHATWAWADVVTSGHAPPSEAQVERVRHHCAELARRGSDTVPAVRSSIEAFSLMCAAEVGRAEQATDPDAWEHAADTFDRLQHPYPSAYARMRQAEALLVRRAHSAQAAEVLRRADDLARALGARPLLDDIAGLAGRARISLETPPPAAAHAEPGVLDVLTARELEVLHEVANGFTNKEIGQRLYISEKTVGVHVARIFTKIGVHSRVQASAVLHRSNGDTLTPPRPAAAACAGPWPGSARCCPPGCRCWPRAGRTPGGSSWNRELIKRERPRGQRRQQAAQVAGLVGVEDRPLDVDGRVRVLGALGQRVDPPLLGQDPQALAAGRGLQPAAERLRLADLLVRLEQAQPGPLRRVAGVGLLEPVGDDHRGDGGLVPPHDLLPSAGVAAPGAAQQLGGGRVGWRRGNAHRALLLRGKPAWIHDRVGGVR